MPATCRGCGATWPRDPALEIACPACRAPVGKGCHRPSGHGTDIHAARDRAAIDAGLLKLCPAAIAARACDAPADPNQPGLFA